MFTYFFNIYHQQSYQCSFFDLFLGRGITWRTFGAPVHAKCLKFFTNFIKFSLKITKINVPWFTLIANSSKDKLDHHLVKSMWGLFVCWIELVLFFVANCSFKKWNIMTILIGSLIEMSSKLYFVLWQLPIWISLPLFRTLSNSLFREREMIELFWMRTCSLYNCFINFFITTWIWQFHWDVNLNEYTFHFL